MNRIPVHVITARAALVGAASYGLDVLYGEEAARVIATEATTIAQLGAK